jgi:hypothetical protein
LAKNFNRDELRCLEEDRSRMRLNEKKHLDVKIFGEQICNGLLKLPRVDQLQMKANSESGNKEALHGLNALIGLTRRNEKFVDKLNIELRRD